MFTDRTGSSFLGRGHVRKDMTARWKFRISGAEGYSFVQLALLAPPVTCADLSSWGPVISVLGV